MLSLCCFVTTVGFTVFKASIVVCACSKATTVKQVRPVKFHRPFKLPTDQTTKLNKRALCYQRFHPACPKEIFILKQLKRKTTDSMTRMSLDWNLQTALRGCHVTGVRKCKSRGRTKITRRMSLLTAALNCVKWRNLVDAICARNE